MTTNVYREERKPMELLLVLLFLLLAVGIGAWLVTLVNPVAASATFNSSDDVLLYGEVETGSFPAGSSNFWRFSGQQGDSIMIFMSDPTLDTYLYLRDTNGNELIRDDDSGGNFDSLINGFVLPYTGEYIIEATGYAGGGGSYTIRFGQANTMLPTGMVYPTFAPPPQY
jgi:hypothetical protein